MLVGISPIISLGIIIEIVMFMFLLVVRLSKAAITVSAVVKPLQ